MNSFFTFQKYWIGRSNEEERAEELFGAGKCYREFLRQNHPNNPIPAPTNPRTAPPTSILSTDIHRRIVLTDGLLQPVDAVGSM